MNIVTRGFGFSGGFVVTMGFDIGAAPAIDRSILTRGFFGDGAHFIVTMGFA